MGYAITSVGWRAVSDGFDEKDLADGERYVDELPQELIDSVALADQLRDLSAIESNWRAGEMEFIGYQITAIEDEDPAALPGTAKQWRDYRIKVRAWIDGGDGYPYSASRPVRPE